MAVPTGKRAWVIAPALAAVLALMVVGTAPGPSPYPAVLAPALSAPVVTAAPINTTAITVSWSAPPGSVANYTLMYARFYGRPIAYISTTRTVYNVTNLGSGLTYYFTVWAWANGTEGPASNVAAAQTNPVPTPPAPPFPWDTIAAVTMLSILGSLAFSAVIAMLVAGRRSRRAEGAAAVAIGRTRPQDREAQTRARRPRPNGGYPPRR